MRRTVKEFFFRLGFRLLPRSFRYYCIERVTLEYEKEARIILWHSDCLLMHCTIDYHKLLRELRGHGREGDIVIELGEP